MILFSSSHILTEEYSFGKELEEFKLSKVSTTSVVYYF